MAQNVTIKQQKALLHLAAGGTITASATKAGVSRRQVERWLQIDAFKRALQQAQHAALEEVSRGLTGAASQALCVLVSTMADETESATVRVRCAEIVLSNLLKLRELVDIEARLAALEVSHDSQKTS